jgi:predicted Zn-dependent protease
MRNSSCRSEAAGKRSDMLFPNTNWLAQGGDHLRSSCRLLAGSPLDLRKFLPGSSTSNLGGKGHLRFLASGIIVTLALILIVSTGSQAAEVQSDDVTKRLEQVATLISENRTSEAEQALSSLLAKAPNDPAALNLFGTIRAKQGRLKEAETLFLRAARSDAHFVGPHENLAYLYTLMGQPTRTIDELRQVLSLDPGNSNALDKLARMVLARGELDEGIRILERAQQSQPLPGPLQLLLGDAYVKKGNAIRAAESYQNALAQNSDDTDAVLGLAQVSQLKGDPNAASAYLARARKMVAHSPDTLYRFAVVAMRAGLFEEANGTLLAAIKLKPDDPAYYLALGTTWLKKPNLADAEIAFRRAVELQAGNPLAEMNLGFTLLEQKKYPEAREWLEKSLSRDKGIPETYFYLGQLAQAFNEDERAIEMFKKAIELAPSYSFAHAALGASYLKLKNFAMAQQELESSLKLNPNDVEAHYQLAVLFARLKNRQRAQEEMEMVEKLKNAGKSAKVQPETPKPDPR